MLFSVKNNFCKGINYPQYKTRNLTLFYFLKRDIVLFYLILRNSFIEKSNLEC